MSAHKLCHEISELVIWDTSGKVLLELDSGTGDFKLPKVRGSPCELVITESHVLHVKYDSTLPSSISRLADGTYIPQYCGTAISSFLTCGSHYCWQKPEFKRNWITGRVSCVVRDDETGEKVCLSSRVTMTLQVNKRTL
jgi:hypothetical protein